MGEHAHEHDHCTMKKFNTRDLIVREDIMAKAEELAQLISTSDEVQIYRKAEERVQQNERVQSLIQLIKKKQKEVVAFETTFKNGDMVSKIEKEMQDLQDELDSIPIVQQFQQTQHDINDLLQHVISIIKDSLSEKINVESGAASQPSHCD